MKKVIILVMSCNIERYINEEHIIRKTWGKAVLDKKYENIELLFYRGGADETYLEGDILYINEDDSLNGTYHKTLKAFKYIENNYQYDYIVRTNTSTYVNIEAIKQFLEFDGIKDNMMYGTSLGINQFNLATPFLKGHYLIISDKIVNILINNTYGIECGIDDMIFGYVLYRYYGDDYLSHLLEIDSVLDIEHSYMDNLVNSYCVRLKDETNFENNVLTMIGFHTLYKNIKTRVNQPHKFTSIVTRCGWIPI